LIEDSGITCNVPLEYGEDVVVSQAKQLATKQYVDELLQGFIV
jgi:hypothetical protein